MWGGRFTDFMAKKVFIKVPYISLVNLILRREAVQELFQSSYSVERMAQNLTALLADSPERAQMLADYDELANIMGQPGSSMRAAQWMTDSLNQQKHI
jgi:Lipid A disaccharide synthetase